MGDVAFVSHQWMSWKHADPKFEQLGTLRRVLERILLGEVAKIEPDWITKVTFDGVETIELGRDDLIAWARDGYIWFDFYSVPQLGFLAEDNDDSDGGGSGGGDGGAGGGRSGDGGGGGGGGRSESGNGSATGDGGMDKGKSRVQQVASGRKGFVSTAPLPEIDGPESFSSDKGSKVVHE